MTTTTRMQPMNERTTITWTPAKYKRLRADYEQAVADNELVMTFEGHSLMTGYAKYLLEYLSNQFKD